MKMYEKCINNVWSIFKVVERYLLINDNSYVIINHEKGRLYAQDNFLCRQKRQFPVAKVYQ